MKLGDISYLVKVPIILTVVIIITASAVTLALTWRAYEDLKEVTFNNAVEIGSILSNSLPDAMLHDDLWSAYRLIQAAEGWPGDASNRLLIVINKDGLIYVSNNPREFMVTTPLRSYGAELARLEVEVLQLTGDLSPRSHEHPDDQRFYVILPMLSDGVAIGTLIIGYDRSLFWPRFIAIIQRVVLSALVVTVLLLPLGWHLGKRMVTPLGQLADCMSMVGREKTEDIVCNLRQGEDEIGQLGVSFQQMLNELEEKQLLEKNMLASERLVAVGRLAAGVAHEINNPLGGMFNALNTFQRYSDTDDLGRETLILITRGLHQIHETVSALLVEANPKSHSLVPEDIDDVYTLLLPDVKKKHIRLLWSNEIKNEISLPSSPIRQLLMNLSLNAVNASLDGGLVQCTVENENGNLCIRVDNEGPVISKNSMQHLFEPFSDGATGNGLGLWVTYQIVQQLDGSIKVESPDGKVRFEVELPIREAV